MIIKSQLDKLRTALLPRLTHTRKCPYWDKEKEVDCNCGTREFSPDAAIASDLETTFKHEVAGYCEHCNKDKVNRPHRTADGFYHTADYTKGTFSDYCENSAFWYVVTALEGKK